MINYESFRTATVESDLFPHFVTRGFLPPAEVAKAVADFAKIDKGGLFLPDFAPYGPLGGKCPHLTNVD
jgi:hypothetical protein